jgi:integrase
MDQAENSPTVTKTAGAPSGGQMRGQFKVTPCLHRRNKHLVTGYTNGQRIRAFFRTKLEAETFAEQKNIELQNFGHELSAMAPELRTEAMVWHQRLRPFGMTIGRVCQKWLDDNDGRTQSVLVKDGIEKFFAERDRQLSANEIGDRHHETLRSAIKKLLPDFAELFICDLSPKILNKWLITQPVAATTRNNIRRNLSVFFTFAEENMWIENNPIRKVKRANTKRLETAEPCIYTPEQAAAILLEAEYDLVPFFAIGMFAGLRTSGIERLDWRYVDLKGAKIKVAAENSKTGQKRFVPMSDNLLEWLAPYAQAQGPVAPHMDEPRRKAVRDRAGIPAKGMSNAMRHSYCSYHFNLHDNGPQTSKNAGHMSVDMLYSNYHHLVEKTACERYFAIRPQDTQNILKVA